MMKKKYGLLLVLLMIAAMALPVKSEGASAGTLQSLYDAAKAEGEVTFWGPVDPEELQPLTAAFNKRFPGVNVKHFEITTGQLVQRIVAEAQAGKITPVDSAQGSISVILPLLDRGLIQGYGDWVQQFQSLKLNPHSVLLDGRALAWYNIAHPISYNTNLLKRSEVPKTWEDLLDPKWKNGKIMLEARAKVFAYLGLRWGEAKMVDYVRRIVMQKPVFTKGGVTALQQLAAGETPLALGTYANKIMSYARDKKAPVDFVDTTSPMGTSQFSTYAFKGAQHPNAAKLFAGWLATPEALKILDDVSFKGPLIPGSNATVYKRLMKNKVELIIETDDGGPAAQLEKKAAKELGIVK